MNYSFFYKLLYPSLTWNFPTAEKKIYLTFDDGPVPVVTEFVLKTLSGYNAKATFFCIGDNVKKYPEIFKMLTSSNHSIGNHTMNHLNGWKTADQEYFKNVDDCKEYVSAKLFRPPYGRIKRSQISKLRKEYKIIMWDVLSKDYDESITGEMCFERIKKDTGNGSIIVFHDSLKSEKRLRYALPASLEYFSKLGFSFCSI